MSEASALGIEEHARWRNTVEAVHVAANFDAAEYAKIATIIVSGRGRRQVRRKSREAVAQ